jgi:hypothetical protein
MGGTSSLGMLLGPEDTGHSPRVPGGWVCFFWWPPSAGSRTVVCWGPGLVGGLLENCTVDASIFDLLWSSF